MSEHSSPPASGTSQTPYRRLKLVVSTSENQHDPTDTPQSVRPVIKEESSSPARPSFSPVTPTLSSSSLNGQDNTQTEWTEEPEPLPVALDDNPDAIALRATLSLLQMQRQQSLRDIRQLSKIRQEALEDPEAFVDDLKGGKLSKSNPTGIEFDQETDESDEDVKVVKQDASKFGKLPVSQNIARCPPIEWSKYHIAGEPLDHLHELQKQYPGVSEVDIARGLPLQSHEIAAPYRPFTDKLDQNSPSAEARNFDS